jgi:hypothetical protein
MPSILKQSAAETKLMPSSTKIKWLDTVVAYHYTYTGDRNLPAMNIAIRTSIQEIKQPARTMIKRHTFRCEADAMISEQKKKQGEHTEHYQKIKPDLARYHWSHLTIDELEAAELEMIDKLDSICLVDASTGNMIHTAKYRELEKELSLLLEMYECLFQKSFVENLLSQSNNKAVSIMKKRDLRSRLNFFSPFTTCLRINVDDESGGSIMQ